MSHQLVDRIIIEPSCVANASVIWLHGLGASGHDFEDVVPYLKLPKDHGIRFIFPHAPERPISINGGVVMPAWYDIADLKLSNHQDRVGIKQSSALLSELIDSEMAAGVPAHRILLMGFSQGAALTLYHAATYDRRLAGIALLSGYVLLGEELKLSQKPLLEKLPAFIGHGEADLMVPYNLGCHIKSFLESQGALVSFHNYDIEHTVSVEELADLGRWMRSLFVL